MPSTALRILRAVAPISLLIACTSPEERLAEHLRRGEQYFAQEQWSEARIEFWNALKIDPDVADAHYKMAESLLNLQQYGDARWEYKEAIRLSPDRLDWRFRLAEILTVAGESSEAREQVEAILSRDPDHADALVLRAVAMARDRDPEKALRDIDRALEIEPDHARGLALRARSLEMKGDLAEAEATYRHLIEVHPTAANHIRFALFWGSQGKVLQAVNQYRAAIEAAADLGERTRARRVLAAFHLTRGDTKAAEEELLAARLEAPDDSALALTLARLYAAQGYGDRAEEMLQARVSQHPERVDPLLTLADFYNRSGDAAKALATTERALEVDPESEIARLQKAEYLIDRTGDEEAGREGRALVEQVLAENPNSVAGLLTLAKALLIDGRYEDAAGKIQRVLDEQPSAKGHLLLGWAYIGMSQLDLARGELLRALQLDPDSSMARMELAALYLRTGQRELALQEARRVLEDQPRNLRMLLVVADASQSLGRRDDALAALDRAKFEGPNDTSAHRLAAGRLFRRLGEPDRARAQLEAALNGSPGDPAVLRELIALDLQARAPDRALERINAAIQSHPERGPLYSLRGAAYLSFRDADGRLRHPGEAEEDLKTAIEKDPTHLEPYGLLATLYRVTGRTEEAIRTFEHARDARPEARNVRLILGTLYEQQGRAAEAIQEYEAVLSREPNQPIAKNNLAWLLAETASGVPQELDRAQKLAEDARELLPGNPNVADTLGWVYLKRDIPKAAIPLFREAIEGYEEGETNRSVVRYHLALAYFQNGDVRRAIEEVEQALSEVERFPNRSDAEALLEKLRAS